MNGCNLLALLLDGGGEFLWRAGARHCSACDQARAECRVGGDGLHIGHNAFPDIRRHIAPSEEADTAFEGEIRITRLARGRHLGDLWRTLAVRHEEELCGAGLMVGTRGGTPVAATCRRPVVKSCSAGAKSR